MSSRFPDDTDGRSGAATIGGFRILRILGEGGMGIVYEAVGVDGTPVALKVLRSAMADAEAALRFERESLVRIDHPNVVRVVAAGVDGSTRAPFLALELLRGATLEERLRSGRLHPADIVKLAGDVARGLHAAHLAGFVHRDLKPANLFWCEDGSLKVMDFGIVLTAADSRLTRASAVIGTAAYMSPEQVRGERSLGPATDVWSLGVVLYEAASGRCPFSRDTPLATMLAIHMEEAEPLWALAPWIPRPLASVIERAMAKRVELRFQSMEELLRALATIDVDPTLPVPSERTPGLAPPHGGVDGPGATEELVPPRSVLPTDEKRIVAIVLVTGARDLAAIDSAIGGQGGVLVPLIGDRAVGLFGALTWEGDEVRRAALAAMILRGAAERVSIASGRATSSCAGISGDVLTAAERGCLRPLAGIGADAATARALDDDFDLVDRGDGVHELLGPRDVAASRDAPLLGRAGELAQLRERLRTVTEDRRAAVVLTVGTPGIGKSRLARALEEEIALGEPFARLATRADPLRRDRAFSLFAGLIRGRLPAAPDTHALTVLARDALGEGEPARRCAEFLGELLALDMPTSPGLLAARADPQLMADSLRLALVDYVEGLARRLPVALVVEDLQWADPASIALLEDLAERLVDLPLLLFASARPELLEARPALFSGIDLLRLDPRGLVLSDVRALAEHVAGQPLAAATVKAIAERTGGHPLFVEQVVLELADRGELDAEVTVLPTTLTIEAAVQARIDQLPPQEKDAAKRASVLARPFLPDELEAMGVSTPLELLGRLVRRDLIVARARAERGAKEHQFKSSLVAEAVYALIAEAPARDLHRRAAAYLALHGGDDEEIGGHHERAGDQPAAATRYVAAALAASRRGDAQTVLRCSDRAMEIGAPTESRLAVHMARADALRFLGRRGEQARELEQARVLATSDLDVARVLTEWTLLQTRTGHPAEAFAAGEAAIAAAERTGDHDVLTSARVNLANAFVYGGEIHRARQLLDVTADAANGASPHVHASFATVRAHLAAACGDLAERRSGHAAAAALHRQTGNVRKAATSDVNLADVENRVGRYAEAESALRAALDGSRRVRNRTTEGYALVNLGYACAAQGNLEEARDVLDQALALATAMGEVRLALTTRLYRARTIPDQNAAERARELIAVASEAETVADRFVATLAYAAGAMATLGLGQLDAADLHSGRALRMLEEQGGIEEDEAEVYLSRARVLLAIGDGGAAAAVLARGRRRLDEVASRIGDEEARKSFLTAVLSNAELVLRSC